MKTLHMITKIVAWAIVVAGCALYGLSTLLTLIYPPKHQSNPIESIKMIFSTDPGRLRFNLIAFAMIILWGVAWGYTHPDKKQ